MYGSTFESGAGHLACAGLGRNAGLCASDFGLHRGLRRRDACWVHARRLFVMGTCLSLTPFAVDLVARADAISPTNCILGGSVKTWLAVSPALYLAAGSA